MPPRTIREHPSQIATNETIKIHFTSSAKFDPSQSFGLLTMNSAAIYLNFDGTCQKAFAFYARVFGKKLTSIMTNGDSPMKDQIPKEHHALIMHTQLDLMPNFALMGSDHNPTFQKEALKVGNHSSITLTPSSKQETERIFQELSEGGNISMPLAEQFWGSLNGAFTDKFGIQWILDFPLEDKKQGEFPKIVECPTQRFFGITGKGPFDTCGPKFNELHEIARKNGLEKNKGAMLVLCDVPNTEKHDLVWACSLLIEDSSTPLPEGLEEIMVPGRRCATTIHHGGYEGLPKSWGDLCMNWVPAQGLKPAVGSRDNVHYEVYIDCSKEDLKTQLFCPLEEAG
jgi:PhnB protein